MGLSVKKRRNDTAEQYGDGVLFQCFHVCVDYHTKINNLSYKAYL